MKQVWITRIPHRRPTPGFGMVTRGMPSIYFEYFIHVGEDPSGDNVVHKVVGYDSTAGYDKVDDAAYKSALSYAENLSKVLGLEFQEVWRGGMDNFIIEASIIVYASTKEDAMEQIRARLPEGASVNVIT